MDKATSRQQTFSHYKGAGIDRISNNSASYFRQCPYKFDLAYRQKIAPVYKGQTFFLGVCIHKALETYYKQMKAGTYIKEDILKAFKKRFDEEIDTVDLGAKETRESLETKGYQMIEGYLIKYCPQERV